jgi:hypothetical protein
MLMLLPFVPRPRTKRTPRADLRRLVTGLLNKIQILTLEEERETLTVMSLIADRQCAKLRPEEASRGRVSPR